METFLSGAITALNLAVAVFQLRFWRRSRDRLFLFFSLAFALMATNRIALSIVADESETRTALYVIRLVAFVIILIAIVDKNARARREAADPPTVS